MSIMGKLTTSQNIKSDIPNQKLAKELAENNNKDCCASDEKYNEILFPYLLKKLKACKPKSVAQYSDIISVAVFEKNKS